MRFSNVCREGDYNLSRTLFGTGWVVSGGWTRIYYHRGESVRLRGGAEALRRRLASVAPAHAHTLHEMTLERGSNPQLGKYTQLLILKKPLHLLVAKGEYFQRGSRY